MEGGLWPDTRWLPVPITPTCKPSVFMKLYRFHSLASAPLRLGEIIQLRQIRVAFHLQFSPFRASFEFRSLSSTGGVKKMYPLRKPNFQTILY